MPPARLLPRASFPSHLGSPDVSEVTRDLVFGSLIGSQKEPGAPFGHHRANDDGIGKAISFGVLGK